MLYREDWFPLRHFHHPYKSTFDRAVVVYVYAVKNDLTNWESNLALDKPFMTNGEFLESLELNENNIPTINGTGEDPQSYFIFIYLKSCHFIHSTHYIVYVPRDSFFLVYTYAHDKKPAFISPRIVLNQMDNPQWCYKFTMCEAVWFSVMKSLKFL